MQDGGKKTHLERKQMWKDKQMWKETNVEREQSGQTVQDVKAADVAHSLVTPNADTHNGPYRRRGLRCPMTTGARNGRRGRWMARPQCSVLERQIAMRLMGLALEINLHAAIDEVKSSKKRIVETPTCAGS